jgi:ribosomal protein S18 acetylase RimI-like enzyme
VSASEVTIRRLKHTDIDLAAICGQLNKADWKASIKDFSATAMREFLSDPHHFYLIGYEDNDIAGAIHGYIHPHPTGVKYMWIDEVDTMVPHRRHGVATAMMREAFLIASEHGCADAWLGSDDDRDPAIALYEGLHPSESEHGPMYSWKIPVDSEAR